MAGSEYEPSDSRNVTLSPNEPGKPNGWREKEAAGETKRGELEPEDSRNVTEEGVPEPGSVPNWREKEARGHEPGGASTPPGVPQEGKPFTAEEAAEAKH
jgi:hypothetical protein